MSADALGATDFNIRLDYSIEAQRAGPGFGGRRRSCHRRRHPLARSEPRTTGRRALTLRKGIVTLDPWTIAATSTTTTRVTVGGSASILGNPSVDAKVDGRLDLRTLSLLFGTYRPAGTAIVNARIRDR